MGASQTIDLRRLFQLQDAAFVENRERSGLVRAIYGPLCKSIVLSYEVLANMQSEAQKQTVIRYFAVDTLSHIVVAARVGLWGALPEGLSTLRGGIESLAQLAFVIHARKYETAIAEVNVKGKFVEVSFQAACNGLDPDLRREIGKLHGRISNVASHSTTKRLRQVTYKLEGKEYDRLGFAVSPENAEIVLHSCMLLCTLLGRPLQVAYQQDNLVFPWGEGFTDLERTFEKIGETFIQADGSDRDAPRPMAENA